MVSLCRVTLGAFFTVVQLQSVLTIPLAYPYGNLNLRATGPTSYQTFEVRHHRKVFFAGGEYAFNNEAKGTLKVNQIYVEQLTPAQGVTKPYPLVFMAGGGLSGTTWLNTPDNRKGWASYFLEKGYAVHLIDYPSTGRSSRLSTRQTYIPTSAEVAENYFTRPELHPESYPQARLHNQWPGPGVRGDPSFDDWYASLLPLPPDNMYMEDATGSGVCDLLKQIGPSYLIGHSFGGMMLFVVAEKCPDLVQGLLGVEPYAVPFRSKSAPGSGTPARAWGLTNTPLTYNPPAKDPSTDIKKVEVGTDTVSNVSCLLQAEPAKKLVNIAKVPVLIYTTEASVHIVFAHCIPAYLWQGGVNTEWVLLADKGIRGNGHFSFVEKNNLEIADKVVEPWFEFQSGPRGFRQTSANSTSTR
ncbi:MAG: hypothetical protein LQ342_007984 [Letrouitia transgressa]|nr:MAG: hypothetical protein LQ342_007984 [Letrouitia transgressa]